MQFESIVSRYSPPRIATLEGYDGLAGEMAAFPYIPGIGIPGVPLAQAPEGAAVATTGTVMGLSPTRAIALGVTTGVLVWFLTRYLDGKFTRR